MSISPASEGAREAARQGNGRFGEQQHGEPTGVSLGAPAGTLPAEAYEAAARAMYVESNWAREITEHYSNQKPEDEYRAKAAARWDNGGAGYSMYQQYPRESAAAVDAAAPFLTSKDLFAGLDGIEKARAQARMADQLAVQATGTYVTELRNLITADHPDAVRLYVDRKLDAETGMTFSFSHVEDVNGKELDVDTEPYQDDDFLSDEFDSYVEFDEESELLYMSLETGDRGGAIRIDAY